MYIKAKTCIYATPHQYAEPKSKLLKKGKKYILKKLVQIPSKPRYDENYNIYIAYSSFFNIDGYTASPSKENRLNIPPGCRSHAEEYAEVLPHASDGRIQ
jgi:hypothetical protein